MANIFNKLNIFKKNTNVNLSRQEIVENNAGGGSSVERSGFVTMGAHPLTPVANTTIPYVDARRARWVYFGEDNLYPQFLIDLYQMSPIHQAIISQKKNLTIGEELIPQLPQDYNEKQLGELAALMEYCDGEETMYEVMSAAALDYQIFGAFCLEVIWNNAMTKIVSIKHISVEKVRIGVPNEEGHIDCYWYCRDWATYRYGQPVQVAAFDPDDTEHKNQFYYVGKSTPGVEFYGMPEYESAMNWIQTESNIGVFHNQQAKQGFTPGFKVVMYGEEPNTVDEKNTISKQIRNNFEGVGNAGKAVIFFASDKEHEPSVEPMPQNDLDKRYEVTLRQSVEQILAAHKVTTPELFGIKIPGQLGTGDLKESFWIFDKSIMAPDRKKMEKVITRLLRLGGYGDVKMTIKPFNPFPEQNTTTQE